DPGPQGPAARAPPPRGRARDAAVRRHRGGDRPLRARRGRPGARRHGHALGRDRVHGPPRPHP
ncbi:MAG: hypothetical protein AVDCRST_MAG79-2006, partial [uncultured Thermoleophilia bacterium]